MDGLGTTHLSSPLAEGHYINLESRSRINVSTRHRLMVCFPSLSCTVAINVRPHTIAYIGMSCRRDRTQALVTSTFANFGDVH